MLLVVKCYSSLLEQPIQTYQLRFRRKMHFTDRLLDILLLN